MRIVTQKEEKIMNMFSLYHETLGYEDSDDDGLSSYIFFHDDCPIPRKEIEMLSISLSKMKERKTPFFTISCSKIEFQSLNYKNYKTIHCIKSTLD